MNNFKKLLRAELERRGYKVLSTKKEIDGSYSRYFKREDYIIIDQQTMAKYQRAMNKSLYRVIQVIIFTNKNISRFDMEETVKKIENQTKLDPYHELDIHVY